jgi:hypothetical protein
MPNIIEYTQKLNDRKEKIDKLKALSHERKVLLLEVVDSSPRHHREVKLYNDFMSNYRKDLEQIKIDTDNHEDYTKIRTNVHGQHNVVYEL